MVLNIRFKSAGFGTATKSLKKALIEFIAHWSKNILPNIIRTYPKVFNNRIPNVFLELS